jgi:serine/threonine-protein kinase
MTIGEMSSCLSEDEVAEFVSGRLTREEYDSLERHLTECRVCLALVARTASAVLKPGVAVGDHTVRDSALRSAVRADGMPLFVCKAGVTVAGRYRVGHRIGQGGMGAVWAARDEQSGRDVAIKVLRGIGGARPDARRRFLREARAASAVTHAHVVEMIELVELPDAAPAIVMDLLVGESLRQRLTRAGVLTLAELAGILVPVISAVGTAHSVGIVHRDLKPDNIFLARTEGGVCPKVLDFGVAKLTATEGDAAQTEGLTATGDMLGTPYYMAPEQAFGESDIDHRCDVWALGVILYECLSGVRPFRGDNLGQLLKRITSGTFEPLEQSGVQVPADVASLIGRMLARERGRRPSDLHEVHDVLARYTDVRAPEFGAAGFASGADPVEAETTADSAPPAPSRNMRLWIALVAASCTALALGAWRLVESLSHPTPPLPAAVAAPPPTVAPPPAAVAPAPASIAPAELKAPVRHKPARPTRPVEPTESPAAPPPAHKPGDVVKEVPF